ncbi:MAG: glycosyltransferase [bacterium]|nr:glycosyltransferase [bacterium]
MKTGMLIINYNDYPSTKKLLNNIKNYSIIDKVIVVDNNSTDDSKKKLKSLKDPKIEIIVSKKNNGYSSAINLGCKELIKQLGQCNIIISNSDIIIQQEQDIKNLLELLSKKNIGVVAPTVLERGILNRGWKQPTPWIECLMNIPYIHRIVRKKLLNYKENHYQQNTSIVDIVSGCFFLIKSTTMQEIDFLDENLFLYYEENVLATKLKKINKKSIIDNKTMIVHNHSVTIDKNMNLIKKYKIQKKSQYYFEKEYNKANIIQRILLKLTATITQGILSIYYFGKDLVK